VKVIRALASIETRNKWAIGDTHGCPKTLLKLLSKIKLRAIDKLYFLGDYINKGPDSKGVLDILIALRDRGQEVVFIRGNNDQKLLDAWTMPVHRVEFEKKYPETLQSFGASEVKQIPRKYIKLLREMPSVVTTKKYVLHHGDLDIVNVDTHTTILEGHTPTKQSVIKSQARKRTKVVLDGGITRDKKGMGQLIAYNFRTRDIVKQQNIDF
jgi:serine/threonine protein phosphatase 1